MTGKSVEFVLESDDVLEFDRLAGIHTGGDRNALLHQAIRIMATRDRAERLQRLQARIHATIGRPSLSEEVNHCPDTSPTLTASIREARAVITACDDAPVDEMDVFFYARGYNALRFALEDLLTAIDLHLGQSR
ncbi:hypothetical protein GCM10023065_02110 [Microbacterium laevaniformans]|uniref:hypothetical protein n=1 Tax=Microbacterium laevaniformans TaxID=36807 RepID=UPI00195C4462|nr:hypothetical protein [Microbacterium laevaniformans]MBM7754096.1 hypothetical protein [Microbacterium laevaniformans]GLJ65844.1 hypothetical protein GCM10017578_27340 [Microbacterium laevaniformans]